MFCNFSTKTQGKWILMGEHAVLRNHPALVFPLSQKSLMLHYQFEDKPLEIDCNLAEKTLKPMSLLAVETLKKHLHLTQEDLKGHLVIQSDIPIGQGLGASAALSLAFARFLNAEWESNIPTLTLAQEIEHHFHGKSSGLDIAGANAESGLHFQSGIVKPLNINWSPKFLLSYSGQNASTMACINKVQQLWESAFQQAQTIDSLMQQAVAKAIQALEQTDAFQLLQESFDEGLACFEQWDLVPKCVSTHIKQLKKLGAIAAKPTGSGGGGFVLSLWEEWPTLPFETILIEVNTSSTKKKLIL